MRSRTRVLGTPRHRPAGALACRLFGLLCVVTGVGLAMTATGADRSGTRDLPAGREVSVAREVTWSTAVWCGGRAIVVRTVKSGLRWIDLVSRKTVLISPTGVQIECSPDGKWVVYKEPKSSRYDTGNPEKGVYDFWRYHLEGGRRERFAVAHEGGRWSPDGSKFLFYDAKPGAAIESPPPAWNLVWTQRPLPVGVSLQAAWLADSTHFLVLERNRLWLERADGREAIRLLRGEVGYSSHLRVDKSDRVYVLSSGAGFGGKPQLLRCEIRGEAVDCQTLVRRPGGLVDYDISADGERIVYSEQGSECLSVLGAGMTPGSCVVPFAEPGGFKLSPDAKRLAFYRERKGERPAPYITGPIDLFIVGLPGE